MRLVLRLLVTLLPLACGTRPPLPDGGGPVLPDGGAPPRSCEGLDAFAGGQRVSTLHARQALLPRARDQVVLLTSEGEVWSVALPGRATRLLHSGADAISWAGAEDALLVQSGRYPAFDLSYVPLQGPVVPLTAAACAQALSPDGRRAYVLRDCEGQNGDLDEISLPSGARTLLAQNVAPHGLAVAPDGTFVAFLQELTEGPQYCSTRGTLVLARGDGSKLRLDTEVIAGTVWIAPTGVVLYEVQRDCGPGRAELMVHTPGGARTLSLGADYDPFFPWMSGYPISPDGRLLLAIRPDEDFTKAELGVLRLDGLGYSALAADVYPPFLTCMAFEPAVFSGDGRYVAYVSAQDERSGMGLSAVSASGGTPVRLATQLFSAQYAISPDSEAIAFLELGELGKRTLVVASLRTGGRSVSWSGPSEGAGGPESLRFTPDGRGLLFVSRASAQSAELHYLSSSDGQTHLLGRWQQTSFQPSFPERGPFVTDPQGCLVLYDTDQGDAPGTYLALLPE